MAENPGQPMTPEQAIFDVRERMVKLETTLLGTPGTDDKGMCGQVVQNTKDLNYTRKKVGRLELKYWLLVGLLTGTGILGGVSIANMFAP